MCSSGGDAECGAVQLLFPFAEQMEDAAWIRRPAGGCFVYLNPAFATVTGVAREAAFADAEAARRRPGRHGRAGARHRGKHRGADAGADCRRHRRGRRCLRRTGGKSCRAELRISNPGRLPDGFPAAAAGTGIGLVGALLPDVGSTLAWQQRDGRAEAHLALAPPLLCCTAGVAT